MSKDKKLPFTHDSNSPIVYILPIFCIILYKYVICKMYIKCFSTAILSYTNFFWSILGISWRDAYFL